MAAGPQSLASKPGSTLEAKTKAVKKKDLNRIANHKGVGTRDIDLPTSGIIWSPEGETRYYYKNAVAWDSWYGDMDIVDEPNAIVFGDNNEVYIQDIYTLWYFGSYTKGTIENNTITVELPQAADYYPSYGYGYDIVLLEEIDGDYVISETQTVKYIIDEETGTFTLDLPGEPYQYALGCVYSDDGSYDGMEFYQEYTPVTDLDINQAPEGAEFTQYMMRTGDVGYPVSVAIDGDNIYIKGISQSVPNSIVVAEVDGNTATISQNQVIGNYYEYWIYTKCYEIQGNSFGFAPSSESYVLNVDFENNTITSAEQDYYFGLAADTEDPQMTLDIFDDFAIFIQTSAAGTPSDPYDLFLDDEYLDYYGFNIFAFTLPNISKEGTVLNSADLYYRIFVDEELMEFEPDEDGTYYGLEGPTTLIPYDFDNGFDIMWGSLNMRGVGLYMEGFTTLGVQAVYLYNGVDTYSNTVTLNVETGEQTTGVQSLFSAPVVNEVYFDMNGRRINNPENGIFIKRSTLSDGKVIVKKVAKK